MYTSSSKLYKCSIEDGVIYLQGRYITVVELQNMYIDLVLQVFYEAPTTLKLFFFSLGASDDWQAQ